MQSAPPTCGAANLRTLFPKVAPREDLRWARGPRTGQGGHRNDRPRVDISVEDHGSISILRGRTDAARAWIEENCGKGNFNPFGHGARLVEHRYIGDIVGGAIGDGLIVR